MEGAESSRGKADAIREEVLAKFSDLLKTSNAAECLDDIGVPSTPLFCHVNPKKDDGRRKWLTRYRLSIAIQSTPRTLNTSSLRSMGRALILTKGSRESRSSTPKIFPCTQLWNKYYPLGRFLNHLSNLPPRLGLLRLFSQIRLSHLGLIPERQGQAVARVRRSAVYNKLQLAGQRRHRQGQRRRISLH